MQKLFTYINSLVEFSNESWEALKPALTKKTYAKGEVLLAEGEVCNSLFFIEEGFVRNFHEVDGKEINIALHFEDEVVTNIHSFSTGELSAYTIEACEPVTVIEFDKEKLREAGASVNQIAILEKNCLYFTAARFEEHTDMFKLYTPTERYEYIAKNKPYILQRVPPHLLASYLQIERERLLRIRKRKSGIDYTL
ncbi:Crp/Fnr family transcriptional regulator [Flavobacterium sp. NRK1]|uniref:Crp/Fnr family transcriptional regulator n=1 Tax=Flavobacterium sp. NRK1 TaxID=2954929 RepID=UPI0020928C08|nr:cyclic nucleotide-binding domain-containing protein [Flavobacterium sp. NRK1]MCO6146519.1 cyclic nucleotide-binding domain-containing protein [Flavobacterium sp. NRK1]